MRGRTWQHNVVQITAAIISGKLNATHRDPAYLADRAADIVDAIYQEKMKRNELDVAKNAHGLNSAEDVLGAAFGDDEPSE